MTRPILLQILWLDEWYRSSMAHPAKALRSTLASNVGRLTGQLHARNSRRQFIPREAFSVGANHHAAHFLQKVHNILAAAQEPFEKEDPVWRLLKYAALHAPAPFQTLFPPRLLAVSSSRYFH